MASVAGLVALSIAVGAGEVSGQDGETASALAARLLATSEILSTLEEIAPAVDAQLIELAREYGVEYVGRVREAARRGFSAAALYPIMRRNLASLGTERELRTVLEWTEAGAVAELRELARASDPGETLEEYAAGLQTRPPPSERTELILRLSQAWMIGDFNVVLDEAVRESAHTLLRAVVPSVPDFTPLPEEAWALAAQNAFALGTLSHLQRYEAASDELLVAVLNRYLSPEGQWFVESYALALMETLLEAADRVSGSLGGIGP